VTWRWKLCQSDPYAAASQVLHYQQLALVAAPVPLLHLRWRSAACHSHYAFYLQLMLSCL
jgi:hypothetical protein